MEKLKEIPIDQIDEPEYDVRTQIIAEGLDSLSESIRAVGVLQPIRVFEKDGRYEIEDGHRRYLAAQMAGLTSIPCFIVDSLQEFRELKKLHANLNREDLTAIEIARTLKHLKDNYGYKTDDLCRVMRKSQGRISQLLSLLNYDPVLQDAILDRQISEQIARELHKIKDTRKRHYYLKYAIDGGATINTVKGWAAREAAAEVAPVENISQGSYAPSEAAEYTPKGRCSLCRHDLVMDSLMIMKFCGECYTQLRNILPSLRQAIKEEINLEDT